MKKFVVLLVAFIGILFQSCTSFPPFVIPATEVKIYENGIVNSNDSLFFPLNGMRQFSAKVFTKTDLVSETPKFLIYACHCVSVKSQTEISQITTSDSLSIEINGVVQNTPQLVEPTKIDERNAELNFAIKAVKKDSAAPTLIGLYLHVLYFTKDQTATNSLVLGKNKSFSISIN